MLQRAREAIKQLTKQDVVQVRTSDVADQALERAGSAE